MVGLNFEVSSLRGDGHDEPDTPLEVVVRYVDYLVERLGLDRVRFGSDFGGATIHVRSATPPTCPTCSLRSPSVATTSRR